MATDPKNPPADYAPRVTPNGKSFDATARRDGVWYGANGETEAQALARLAEGMALPRTTIDCDPPADLLEATKPWSFDRTKFRRVFQEDDCLLSDPTAPHIPDTWKRLTGTSYETRAIVASVDNGDAGYDLISNGWVIEWSYEGGGIWEPVTAAISLTPEGALSVPARPLNEAELRDILQIPHDDPPIEAEPPAADRDRFERLGKLADRLETASRSPGSDIGARDLVAAAQVVRLVVEFSLPITEHPQAKPVEEPPPVARGLKNPEALLADIAVGVRRLTGYGRRVELGVVQVAFVTPDGERFEFGLDAALEAIANDLFFDERGDWSEARGAEVSLL